MYLYLVQHGEPKSKEEDPERPLSEKGKDDVDKIASFISLFQLKEVFHSGKLRAKETADMLAKKVDAKVLETDGLSPMDDPGTWAGRLKDRESNTMLVGHLPHMGRLASLLLCGDKEAGTVEFRQGGVVCLRRQEGTWSVQWMVLPAFFDRGIKPQGT